MSSVRALVSGDHRWGDLDLYGRTEVGPNCRKHRQAVYCVLVFLGCVLANWDRSKLMPADIFLLLQVVSGKWNVCCTIVCVCLL